MAWICCLIWVRLWPSRDNATSSGMCWRRGRQSSGGVYHKQAWLGLGLSGEATERGDMSTHSHTHEPWALLSLPSP